MCLSENSLVKKTLISFTVVLLTACQAQAPGQSAKKGVSAWLNDKAGAIRQQLATQPRFEGRSIKLAITRYEESQPVFTALLGQLREQLKSELRKNRNIRLLRDNPSDFNAATSSCANFQEPELLVTLNGDLDHLGNYRLRIAAQEAMAANELLGGFSYEFYGPLTAREQRLQSKIELDSSAKGSREVPFSQNEAEPMIAKLSARLICQLSRYKSEDLVIFDGSLRELSSPFKHFIGHRLAQLLANSGEVRLSNLGTGNASLEVDLQSDRYLSASSKAELAEPITRVYANILLNNNTMRGVGVEAYIYGEWLERPPMPSANVVSSFRLITPVDSASCSTDRPWYEGARYIRDGATMNNGNCFAIQATVDEPTAVFLLYLSPEQSGERIFPSECRALQGVSPYISPGSTWQFPDPEGDISSIHLTGSAGYENVYLVSVQGFDAQQEFARDWRRFPDSCAEGGNGNEIIPWLDEMMTRYPKNIQWDVQRIYNSGTR